MKKLVIPNEIVELSDASVEVLVLTETVKRLNINYAPNLKKIINLSEYLVIGPENVKADVPVLNKCNKLNEIITYGYIKFNTKIETNGKSIVCAWTGLKDDNVPTLTSVGCEYLGNFPCYYYDINIPIEEVDASLVYAYPTIRSCKVSEFKTFITKALNNLDEVTNDKFSNYLYEELVTAPVKVKTRFSKQTHCATIK